MFIALPAIETVYKRRIVERKKKGGSSFFLFLFLLLLLFYFIIFLHLILSLIFPLLSYLLHLLIILPFLSSSYLIFFISFNLSLLPRRPKSTPLHKGASFRQKHRVSRRRSSSYDRGNCRTRRLQLPLSRPSLLVLGKHALFYPSLKELARISVSRVRASFGEIGEPGLLAARSGFPGTLNH